MSSLGVGVMNLENNAGSDFWFQICHLPPESGEAASRLPTADVHQPLVILAFERMLTAVE